MKFFHPYSSSSVEFLLYNLKETIPLLVSTCCIVNTKYLTEHLCILVPAPVYHLICTTSLQVWRNLHYIWCKFSVIIIQIDDLFRIRMIIFFCRIMIKVWKWHIKGYDYSYFTVIWWICMGYIYIYILKDIIYIFDSDLFLYTRNL